MRCPEIYQIHHILLSYYKGRPMLTVHNINHILGNAPLHRGLWSVTVSLQCPCVSGILSLVKKKIKQTHIRDACLLRNNMGCPLKINFDQYM